MKVIILATGKIEEHNDSYGARLIEQGKAIPAPVPKAAPAKKNAERKE